jgi:hypothetical protein
LSVISINPFPPLESLDRTTATVTKSDAITIIFSKAVIPLGRDFGRESETPQHVSLRCPTEQPAGHWRWVTTYILRFDPAGLEWPSDLTCTLTLSKSMSTFTADTLAEPVSVSFTTPLLSVSSISVSSAIAAAATDGAWSSPVPEDEPNYDMPLHEIPADALMPVTLSADVDPQKFADAVELVGASGIISRESNTSSCGWLGRSSSRCVVLKIQELAPGSIATLRLKPNAAYSASEIQSVSVNGFDIARVTGIVPFKFRFRTARGSNPGMLDHTPQYRRYSLFIRHGMVGDAGAFAQSMKFVPNVADISFKLQGKTRLIIEGKFEPSTSYSLGISASATIKDGFGMPLEGSQLMFTTAKLPDYFQYVDRTVQFTSSFTSNMGAWMLGTSKVSGYYGRDASLAPPQSIEFYGVTDRNIQQVIAQTYNGRDMLLGKADAVITADAGVQYPTFSAASVVSPSGLTLWVGHQHRNSLRHGLVTASDLSASFISSSDGSVTVFVWDTETLKPLASPAEVRFYQLSKTYRVQVSDVVAVSSKVTSSTDSVTFSAAELKRSPNSQQLVAVVKHGSKLQIFKPHLRYVPQDGQMASPKVTISPTVVCTSQAIPSMSRAGSARSADQQSLCPTFRAFLRNPLQDLLLLKLRHVEHRISRPILVVRGQ